MSDITYGLTTMIRIYVAVIFLLGMGAMWALHWLWTHVRFH